MDILYIVLIVVSLIVITKLISHSNKMLFTPPSEADILRRLKKMKVTKDDILILTGHFDQDTILFFSGKIKEKCSMVLIMEPGQSLKCANEAVMNTYGWYRREKKSDSDVVN